MRKHLQPAELNITEDDATIAAMLERANIPTLIMSIIHVTGDTRILYRGLNLRPAMRGEVQGGLTQEDKIAIRSQALEALKNYRDSGCKLPPPPSEETIHAMMNMLVGQEVSKEYVPMFLEEMALDGKDVRRFSIDDSRSGSAKEDFHTVVIGAGMSGLLAAKRLEEAGIRYTVIEKNDAVGGTWYENSYPGCRVDVANHFYSYSFEPNHDWPEFFSQRNELHRYFENCADDFNIRSNIRFSTEVVAARYNENTKMWHLNIRDKDNRKEELICNAIVSAVGQLNRPKIPDIKGLDSFEGVSFHSAQWQHEYDLRGKRVAVIGTGASAFQLSPEVAKQADKLFVFQRSAPWMSPNPSYHKQVSEAKKWCLKHLPYYARWYRFLLFWPASDGLLPALKIDPDWPHQDRSINETNEATRVFFTDHIKQIVGDDEALLNKVVPTYPPFCKRMLQDNGTWLSTLKKDNVDLMTDGIDSITRNGILCKNGQHLEVDVIVFATGFHANKYLWPMDIIGLNNRRLNELWGDDPSAYLGITVPAFPNLFCIYGPGTNLAHAGSIIFHSECQVRYIMGCIKSLIENSHSSMECKKSVHDAYNERLQKTLQGMVWSHPDVSSWYKNSKGKVTVVSPWRLVDYWQWTKEPNLDDFELC